MEKKERDLSFEVNNSKDLRQMLTGVLMDARRGLIDHATVKSITLVADKINKNSVNEIEYKKLTSHKRDLSFFEEDCVVE